MHDCCGLTRWRFLPLESANGAAALLDPLLGPLRAQAAAVEAAGAPVAQDLEMVTVTDTSFTLTWYTGSRLQAGQADPRPTAIPTDAVVHYGTDPGRLDRRAVGPSGTAYHHVEVTGLEPGTTYHYRAESAGVVALPRPVPVLDYSAVDGQDLRHVSQAQFDRLMAALLSPGRVVNMAPGSVTTLVPPPGEHLFTLALTNDLHIGETESGVIANGFPPPYAQRPGELPYPVVMGRSMVADITRRGAAALIVAGDLTSAALPAELTGARRLLDSFGPLVLSGDVPSPGYVVTRGNHDQPKRGDAYACCPSVPGQAGYHDCLPGVFPLPQGTLTTTELCGLRLIGLDTTTLSRPGGAIGPEQFAELGRVLAQNPEQPTLVFGHHPVTDESASTTIAGPAFNLDRADAAALEALYAATPGVFLHHSGHTHRNKRTSSPVAPGVEFLEVGAVKEYPGGYALLRVHEGGYMVNFHKCSAPGACEWSQASSGEYLGLYPASTLGSPEERNHVVTRAFPTLSKDRSR